MKIRYKQYYEEIKSGSFSLRRRFVLYVSSLVVASVILLLFLLSLFGVLNPVNGHIETHLDNQLDAQVAQMKHAVDKLAAYSLSFSNQMEIVIEDYLANSNMSFSDLTNDVEALTTLQREVYDTVYSNIRTAPCSGAFYILNTTVNNTLDAPSHNGIYIRFANLYAESTVNTKISLYRGFSEIARENNINLSSTWQNEMITDAFKNTNIYSTSDYFISNVAALPDSWERARYIYSPIHGENGQLIGICGFEVSDLYLQLSYSTTDTKSAQTVCALLNKTSDGYVGQFVSNRSGYTPPVCETITTKTLGSFYEFACGKYKYIGKAKEVIINGNNLTIAIMLPKHQYEAIVRRGQLTNIVIFFITAIVAICACLWLSKKYIMPINKSITQIKSNKNDYLPSGITEIDDLFAFLAEKDRKNEIALSEMESEKTKLKSALDQMNCVHDEAKLEISRLAYSRKNEINPYDYEQFLTGVKTLTQMERTVFNHYLAGKSVKEIIELEGIKESTVRFHNRNIYSKLGVNSLKQLLLFATVMKREESES